MEHEGLAGEMHVGGVYLRLYMRNPQYPLRHPKTFLEASSALWVGVWLQSFRKPCFVSQVYCGVLHHP